MKNFIWFVVGVTTGLLIAREAGKTRQGKQFFADLDTKAREFGEAISDGYRKREAELRDAIGDIESETEITIEKLAK
ncbi:hypothetical protein E3T34_06050 [Cryobacterium sp. TMT1-62]|uniref:YtxH domain-containing protein n=1 Tax=Cryobacterium sandaracinum TaxID=1259247 RepID=A0ABY2JJ82_9MICO|nr:MULTISPECIES: hypothetical protein [Cryobacterium]TFB53767.1 hypothetical protein E3N94_14115 [Cryobacterium sp. Sr3]TFB57914.1 hypothetical protein E3N86_15290 [Cryobacterium sp. Hz7]TFC39414.1 hypothetical protein E3O28_02150 [Cryobacterium sp. TMT2-14]TFC49338.1 hypothetical protein E3O47_11860 [Cryobacterium sp. TMT2-17-1]TFC70777.1 hypothetical protein E3O54_02235 [Cryobacterium sp. TMT2-4]